ncbi:MAG: hypothetical protein JAZ15_09570, partial [Candidatus Thiodiazotropha endolucinida]|nr:hypothetical protein [Candidatus Thiodiazotropha taylori]MCW4313262.1 hypothetical protein [Candidatus Thiodiazotropha taylori]
IIEISTSSQVVYRDKASRKISFTICSVLARERYSFNGVLVVPLRGFSVSISRNGMSVWRWLGYLGSQCFTDSN